MLETLFQNTTHQVQSKYKDQLNRINEFSDDFKNLSDLELKNKTTHLKNRLQQGEEKINIVKTSNLEFKDFNKEQNFEFSFNFEFIPEIKLSEYKSMEVEKEIFSIEQKDIDKAIENLLLNFATIYWE